MGECKLDHTHEDVLQKLDSQRNFLPESLISALRHFLQTERSQNALNELFHLLKKYDLASELEREERNGKLRQLIG